MTQEPTAGEGTAPDSPPASAPGGAPPSPPPPAAPAGGMPAWSAPPTAPVPGAPGFFYADVPNRVIALIIDWILLAIIGIVVSIVVSAAVGPVYDVSLNGTTGLTVETNYLSALIQAAAGLVVSAVYWIYSWTRLRGSPGQRVLGMQVGNFPDGATLSQDQAIRRWVALGGPLPIVQALNPIPTIGFVIGLLAFAYFIYLLYSTAVSPTKQGFHDKFANSVVVKAARAV